MLTVEEFKKLALSFENATEEPHFEKASFRVNKKIFATLNSSKCAISLKLTPVDQSVFCSFDSENIYQANGPWGKQGWTIFEFNKLKEDLIEDALTLSYCNVAPKNLALKYLK
ncbi:MmcQ/YjbR family DNA-binding protein [Pedobacter jejuensis]|uniref:MmcQ/YjbR family DNA-binding protein n=1 Tax=Pedobacter jejuensis TaxID=1268550 RepID=A0A3N0BU22_9SPHI|nr:MmcQ/YjbR family DNA-binding protein [Pedobacter jejuensis]RNL52528.1 MmcQ/YjbR family DNA-binding protein [Pedobacter jejuensis]